MHGREQAYAGSELGSGGVEAGATTGIGIVRGGIGHASGGVEAGANIRI